MLLDEIVLGPDALGLFTLDACHHSMFDALWRAILKCPGSINPRLGHGSGVSHVLTLLMNSTSQDFIERAMEENGIFRPSLRLLTLTHDDDCLGSFAARLARIKLPAVPECWFAQTFDRLDVALVLENGSDAAKMAPAIQVAQQVHQFLLPDDGDLRIDYGMRVVSAHRAPHLLWPYVTEMERRGVKAIIAIGGFGSISGRGGGCEALLPSILASMTRIPVISFGLLGPNSGGFGAVVDAESAMLLALKIAAAGKKGGLSRALDMYKKRLADNVSAENDQLEKDQ